MKESKKREKMNPIKLLFILITGATGLLVWALGLFQYILYFIILCFFSSIAVIVCVFIAKNWKGLNIGRDM